MRPTPSQNQSNLRWGRLKTESFRRKDCTRCPNRQQQDRHPDVRPAARETQQVLSAAGLACHFRNTCPRQGRGRPPPSTLPRRACPCGSRTARARPSLRSPTSAGSTAWPSPSAPAWSAHPVASRPRPRSPWPPTRRWPAAARQAAQTATSASRPTPTARFFARGPSASPGLINDERPDIQTEQRADVRALRNAHAHRQPRQHHAQPAPARRGVRQRGEGKEDHADGNRVRRHAPAGGREEARIQRRRQPAQKAGRRGETRLAKEAPRAEAQDEQPYRGVEFGKQNWLQQVLQAVADAWSGAPVAEAEQVEVLPATGEPVRQAMALATSTGPAGHRSRTGCSPAGNRRTGGRRAPQRAAGPWLQAPRGSACADVGSDAISIQGRFAPTGPVSHLT